MGQAVCARAPARIDFAGGWTDVAEYAHDPPGVVLNVAIILHACAVVRPRGAADGTVRICSADFDRCVEAAAPEGLEYDGTLDLLKGAVRALPPGTGVEVLTRSVAPPGSGLGASAAACRIEREELHIHGGKHDQ